MSKFKVGDRVIVSDNSDANVAYRRGEKHTIIRVNDGGSSYEIDNVAESNWYPYELDLIKEKTMSTAKYYRVLKDHPYLEIGAIIGNADKADQYRVVDSVFLKEEVTDNIPDGLYVYEAAPVVEHAPEFYERVYAIGKLEKMLFGNKKQAQAAAATIYKEGK